MFDFAIALVESQPTPKLVEVFFYCAGLVFLGAGGVRAYVSKRRWKDQPGNQGKRYKMSRRERLEIGLYNLGWTVSFALGFPDWRVRAVFGSLSLASILVLMHRLDLRADDAPTYDEASTLHLRS